MSAALRSLQLELERLEYEAETAPILRQQQRDDALLEQERGNHQHNTNFPTIFRHSSKSTTTIPPLAPTTHNNVLKPSSTPHSTSSFASQQTQQRASLFIGNNNIIKTAVGDSKAKSQFEEAMKMQAAANLRRVRLSNDFVETTAIQQQQQRAAKIGVGLTLSGVVSETSSQASGISAQRKRRFEQAPIPVYEEHSSNLQEKHQQQQQQLSKDSPHLFAAAAGSSPPPLVNNKNSNLHSLLGVKNSPPSFNAQNNSDSIPSNKDSPPSNQGDSLRIKRKDTVMSSISGEKNAGGSSGSPTTHSFNFRNRINNNNNNTPHYGSNQFSSQHHHTTTGLHNDGSTDNVTVFSHQGKALAKRTQLWNNETNFLQSALSDITSTNATLTLREYRRTKPRVISNNHLGENTDTTTTKQQMLLLMRPASAPNNATATSEAASRANSPEAVLSKAPFKQQQHQHNSIIIPPNLLEEATQVEVVRGPNLSRYNDPSLELKANKRLSDLMSREAEERTTKFMRHLGATRLEEMMLIDEETLDQQSRATSTANAAKRRAQAAILKLQQTAANINMMEPSTSNNDNYNNNFDDASASNSNVSMTGLVPPRVILQSAQDNIHEVIRRELAQREKVSLSDLAMKIADDAFEEESKRKRDQENALSKKETEAKVANIMATRKGTSAAEAVLLVKHQAKLETTKQSIKAELNRCKFLVDELKQQSEKAEKSKLKLQEALAGVVQKLGRGFVARRRLVEAKTQQQKKVDHVSSPSVIAPHRRSPQCSSPEASGTFKEILEQEENQQNNNNHNNNNPHHHLEAEKINIVISTHQKNVMLRAGETEKEQVFNSEFAALVEESKKDFLACGDGKAINSNVMNNNNSTSPSSFRDQQKPTSFFGNNNNIIVNDDSSSRAASARGGKLKRKDTAVFSNQKLGTANNNQQHLENHNLQQQLQQRDLEMQRDSLAKEHDEILLKELLAHRQSLQKLAMGTAEEQQQEERAKQQIQMMNQQNHHLIPFVQNSNNGISQEDDDADDAAGNERLLELTTGSNNAVSQLGKTKTLKRSVDSATNKQLSTILPESVSPLPQNAAFLNLSLISINNPTTSQVTITGDVLEALVSTQDQIIQLLTQRQAASVKTIRLLQEAKMRSRQSQRAAVVIQSIARMFLARKRFMQMLQDRDFEDLSQEAALMIQKFWRGKKAREICARRKKLLRRFRRVVTRTNQNNKISSSKSIVSSGSIRQAAASAIQSIWLCFSARKVLHRLRAARSEGDALKTKHDAAKVMTAFMRRVAGRRKLQEELTSRILEHMSTGIHDTTMQDREREVEQKFAVLVIVRIWRTHVQMKKFQRQKNMREFLALSCAMPTNLMTQESFAELVYATERIQNFLITKSTERAARRIIFADSVRMNVVSGVPKRNWNIIAILMEKKMEKEQKVEVRREFASAFVASVLSKKY